MKPWQLNKRVNNLSENMADSVKTETSIDFRCLSQPERELLERVQEIIDEYAPAMPPKDVIEKNADLWHKGLEIFRERATELFVDVIPDSFCCDEFETWYFKVYFYNFLHDWLDHVKELRAMPKKQYQELFAERKEMGMLDMIFRLKRYPPPTSNEEEKL
jgi:hypothetical protein